MEEDRQELGPPDAPAEDAFDTPPTIGNHLSTVAEDEMDFLDGLKLKGFPKDEAQRRKAWMELPRATGAAIRRMHHLIGHKSNSVLIHRVRGARAHKRLIDGASKSKCDDCAPTFTESAFHPTVAPSLYICSRKVLIDMLEEKELGRALQCCIHGL